MEAVSEKIEVQLAILVFEIGRRGRVVRLPMAVPVVELCVRTGLEAQAQRAQVHTPVQVTEIQVIHHNLELQSNNGLSSQKMFWNMNLALLH